MIPTAGIEQSVLGLPKSNRAHLVHLLLDIILVVRSINTVTK